MPTLLSAPSNRCLRLLIALSAMLFVIPASAVRYYDVELILFENKDHKQVNHEVWPAVNVVGEPSAIDLFGVRGDIPLTGNQFQVLGIAEKQLSGTRTRLNNASAYRPIMHLAWRQPGLGASKAIPVKIAGGRRYVNPAALYDEPEPTTTGGQTTQAVTPGELGRMGSLAAAEPEEVDELEGTIKVVLGRYLHVHTDLVFRRMMPNQFGIQPAHEAPADSESPAATTTTTLTAPAPTTRLTGFRMKQHRRMRSNELHYIDHPAFGMVVIIRRAPEQTQGQAQGQLQGQVPEPSLGQTQERTQERNG